jgi:hypothetical protein
MSRRRDPLRLSANWHVDCRIEAELPEDSVVGAHFLIHVSFGVFAVAATLLTGWLAYRAVDLRGQIKKWERHIAETAREVSEIQRLQREYVAEATKVDQAYATIRSQLYFSELLGALSRSLPAQITVDMIDWNENGMVMRGIVRESKQRAPLVLRTYIDGLKKDERVGPHFTSIKVTSMPPPKTTEDQHSFEITFQPNPLPPL